ncbi:MAG: sigma factor-like helix-turn-helix DNA-binding protein, partial [Candidatus Roizmanbacteria bacterium]
QVIQNDSPDIEALLSGIPARNAQVLTLRYGLLTGIPMSRREVSKRFGLTAERIRQLEEEGLESLRRRPHLEERFLRKLQVNNQG